MKNLTSILFIICFQFYAANMQAAEQIIETTAPINININQQVDLDVNYRTNNPVDDTLTGLGLRIHWNSQQLQFNSITNVLNTGLFSQGVVQNDGNDLDGDPNTDKFILISWFDVTGSWPNSGQNLTRLYNIQFTTTALFNSTTVKYSSSSTANGYHLQFAAANIFRNNQNQTQSQPQAVPVLSWMSLILLTGLLTFSTIRSVS